MTGFICLDKPCGITSFAAVAAVRRITGERKAGHCGTLDPMASGVLPIMLGGATRFLDFLPARKRYTAVMRLGVTTDTLDTTGNILSRADASGISKADVEKAASGFTGEIMQIPPMYSALKKDGVRMYELARQGKEVEREPRPVTVFGLRVFDEWNPTLSKTALELGENEYILDVECSKGTYIRTLIDDIGEALGCGAAMSALIRTNTCGFDIASSVTLEELEAAAGKDELEKYVTPVFDALFEYPALTVSDGQAVRFSNGGALNLDRLKDCKDKSLYRVISPDGEFRGLGYADAEAGSLSVKRIYVGR